MEAGKVEVCPFPVAGCTAGPVGAMFGSVATETKLVEDGSPCWWRGALTEFVWGRAVRVEVDTCGADTMLWGRLRTGAATAVSVCEEVGWLLTAGSE